MMVDIQRRLVQDSSHDDPFTDEPRLSQTTARPPPGPSMSSISKSTFNPISLTSANSSRTEKRDGEHHHHRHHHLLSAHDRKWIRSVVKSFDASVNHLRAVVQSADRCLHLPRRRRPRRAFKDGGSGSGDDDDVYSPSSPSLLLIALDLGQDPRQPASIGGGSSCFHGKGLYFVVEAYLFPSEQFLQKLKVMTKEEGSSSSAVSGSAAAESELLTRCRRRRSAGCGGIVAEGGHFDHLINAHRAFYASTGMHVSAHNEQQQQQQLSRRPVVACGLRLNLDRLVGLIAKYEMRQSKIRNMLRSKSNSVVSQLAKYSFVDRFRSDLSAVLESGRDAVDVDVLVQDADRPIGSCSPSPAVLSVLAVLRSCGVRATCMLHQLSCNVAATDHATSAEEACSQLRIPLLCVVQSEASVILKVRTVIACKYYTLP